MHDLFHDVFLDNYQGILYIDRDALDDFYRSNKANSEIKDIQIKDDIIELIWNSGNKSQVSWYEIKQRIKIADLPSPQLASVDKTRKDEISILITSNTPHIGLPMVMPYSVIPTIGRLTRSGFHPFS